MIQSSLVFLFLLFSTSGCFAQSKTFDGEWRDFNSDEAGLKATFPCDPERTALLPSDKEKTFDVFSFTCKRDGINFLVPRRKHLDPFNDETIKNSFNRHRATLRSIFGEPWEFTESDRELTDGFHSRTYRLSIEKGGFVSTKIVVGDEATFEVMVGITPDDWSIVAKNKIDYEMVAKRFINSLEIVK